MPRGRREQAGSGSVDPLGSALAERPPAGAIDRSRRIEALPSSTNRELTFGYLLGYLSLALHATLEYSRFSGYYVGPWFEQTELGLEEQARAWTRSVVRRSSYSPELPVGELTAVLSDGPLEPLGTFGRLGSEVPVEGPPRRVSVRQRLPRVDLVAQPSEGAAYELHDFAREVGERFRRNLD